MTDGRNVEIFQKESHTAPLHIHQMQIFIFSSHSPSTLPSELYLGSVSVDNWVKIKNNTKGIYGQCSTTTRAIGIKGSDPF